MFQRHIYVAWLRQASHGAAVTNELSSVVSKDKMKLFLDV